MDNLDEELLARAEEEQARRQQLEQEKLQERRQQQPGAASQLADVAKDQAKQYVKKEAYAAASSFLVSTAPIWGPALGILAGIVLVLGLVVFIFSVMVAGCNQGGLSGAVAKIASWAVLPVDVCKQLAIGEFGQSGFGTTSGT